MVKLYFGYAVWYSISDGCTRLFLFLHCPVQFRFGFCTWVGRQSASILGWLVSLPFIRRAVSPEAIVIFSFSFLSCSWFYLLFTYLVDSHFFCCLISFRILAQETIYFKPFFFLWLLEKVSPADEGAQGRYVLLSFFSSFFLVG